MARKSEYKPLLFTTTLRNPERLKGVLWVLNKYKNQILTNDLATEIVGELIRYGLYRPLKKTEAIVNKWKSSDQGTFADYILTDDEVVFMLKNNPQKHKEAGFGAGFPSRFATIYDFTKELGFVYFNIGEKILFSELGQKLAEIYSVIVENDRIFVEIRNAEYEQQAFLQAMCKYQRKNPFVRVLNDNVPLILLLSTILKLNADSAFNDVGISYKELPLLIFWRNNDSEELYQRIKQLRLDYGYNPSDEVIVDICVNEIMGGFKKFKTKSIVNEYPDEFIRKMRLTGLISLRGAGRFIDVNHNEDEKIKYVLSKYSKYELYKTEKDYFDYVSTIDKNLFAIKTLGVSSSQSELLLSNWLSQYNWSSIKGELEKLATKSDSSDAVLKFIPKPVRLEFLTALAVKSKLPNVRVIPNYVCDDTGLPTSTAGGNKGDIECFEEFRGVLVEVTMAEGRTQTMMEVWPIERHLVSFKEITSSESQCVFVAPSIYADTNRQIDYVRTTAGHIIRPYKIVDFISFLENTDKLYISLS